MPSTSLDTVAPTIDLARARALLREVFGYPDFRPGQPDERDRDLEFRRADEPERIENWRRGEHR